MTCRDDRRGGRRGAPLVELENGEAHQGVAREVGALAEELPGVACLSLGGEAPYRVVDVREQSRFLHCPVSDGLLVSRRIKRDKLCATLYTRLRKRMSSQEA